MLLFGSIIAVCTMTILSNSINSRIKNDKRESKMKRYAIRRKSNRF